MKLRQYQQEAVDAVVSAFENDDRVQVRMAPGTGKTFVSKNIAAALGSKTIVFLTPTIHLVHQTYKAWAHANAFEFTGCGVCSVGMSREEKEELEEMGHEVTVSTNEGVIADALNVDGVRVVFSTYRSASTAFDILDAKGIDIDLIICDEAHNIAGQIDREITYVLTRNEKIVFLSATPRVVCDEENCAVVGMSDADFGTVAYTLTFKRAVELGALCDYEIVLAVSETEEEFPAIVAGAIDKAMKKYGVHHALTFHGNVQRAEEFVENVGETFKGVMSVVSYKDSAKSRVEKISKFRKAKRGLIANVKALGEGVDITDVDVVAFVDSKKEQHTIVQNAGRVMRNHPGKTKGIVVIPVVGDATSVVSNLEAGPHSILWSVLNALGTYDDVLVGEVDESIKQGSLTAYIKDKVTVLSESRRWVVSKNVKLVSVRSRSSIEAMKAKIFELHEKGMTKKQIADELSIQPYIVFNHLRKAGLVQRKKVISDKVKQQAVALVQRGEHRNKVAKKFGVCHTTVGMWCRANGVNSDRGFSSSIINKIQKMHKKGMSTYKIAKTLSLHHSSVRYHIDKQV